MATNNRKQSDREFLIEWMGLYRKLPSLWNSKCKDYHKRNKKKEAYDLLLAKYRHRYPEATKVDVRKKINVLRTNYRKEYKKLRQLQNSDDVSDDEKIPRLWYYDALSFLNDLEPDEDQIDDVYYIEHKIDTEGSPTDTRIVNRVKTERETYNLSNELDQDSTSFDEHSEVDFATSSPKPSSSRTYNIHPKCRYEEPDSPCKNLETNEYQNWALDCAAELQKMDSVQQIFAKKAIADIIMEGRLGLLKRNSVKINDPVDKIVVVRNETIGDGCI